MITAARLPAPTLNIVASLFTKFFSCSYCGALILRDESITKTMSNSSSHFGSGSVVLVVVMARVVEGCVVVISGVVIGAVVVVFVVATSVVVIIMGADDGSFETIVLDNISIK